MRKVFFIISLIISIMTFTLAFASNDHEESISRISCYVKLNESIIRTNKLPESVEVIEDGAFEGTSISNISLPETVTTIGDRAFANIKTLRTIKIPKATISIAKTAFLGSNHVTINAAPNSYGRTWAKENRIPFSPITVMYAGTGGQNATGSISSATKEIIDTESSETQDTNRTWRKLEEIQVHDTIEIIANVIQGRAPPKA